LGKRPNNWWRKNLETPFRPQKSRDLRQNGLNKGTLGSEPGNLGRGRPQYVQSQGLEKKGEEGEGSGLHSTFLVYLSQLNAIPNPIFYPTSPFCHLLATMSPIA